MVKVLLHCAIFSATCLATPFATQVAGELQCNRGRLATFFVARSVAQSRTLVYFSQRIAASFNAIAQCFTPPATFAAIFESRSQLEHAHFLISLWGAILILAPSLPRPKMLQVAGENCAVYQHLNCFLHLQLIGLWSLNFGETGDQDLFQYAAQVQQFKYF